MAGSELCDDPFATNVPFFCKELREETISQDDASWILGNAFLILTMQTGFGMLEAGCVSAKNVANIMIKNVVDVTLGGITYWCFGFGLSFGHPCNPFCGLGSFFVTARGTGNMGSFYSKYLFQFSFATAATTIVSGAVAERIKLSAYMVFSALNTFVYCFPASWVWNEVGFLKTLGFFDFAGACVVHLTGGASALAAAFLLGPRLGRFSGDKQQQGMSSPVTALTGTFMLWWAWLAFNCGSTFGVDGHKWKIAAKVGVNTLNGSIGGSLSGLFITVITTWRSKDGMYFNITYIISSVLGGLIGVTACCAIITPAEAILIGAIGGSIAVVSIPAMEKLKIDDPVGAVPVHLCSAIWSTLAVGIFGKDDFDLLLDANGNRMAGLFRGGGFHLLGVQCLGLLTVGFWSLLLTALIFSLLDKTMGIRMSPEDEILGADWVEHRVKSERFASKLENALTDLQIKEGDTDDIVIKALNELLQGATRDVDSRIRNVDGGAKSEAESRVSRFSRRATQSRIQPLASTHSATVHSPAIATPNPERAKTMFENFIEEQGAVAE